MKKADAIVQSLLLLLTFISLLLSITTDPGFCYFIFYLQLILIVWQMVAAMEMVGSDQKYSQQQYRKARIYLLCFFTYIVGFALVCGRGHDMLLITWFYSGWIFILPYFVFTLRVAFAKAPKRRTFMDII